MMLTTCGHKQVGSICPRKVTLPYYRSQSNCCGRMNVSMPYFWNFLTLPPPARQSASL